MAIAAIMPMIATTMSNSISENPFWLLYVFISVSLFEDIEFRSFVAQGA
jgi:hypothetical protein